MYDPVGDMQGILLIGAIYFAPAIIASMRRHRQILAIFVLNLVAGWTLIGWIAALVWAFIRQERRLEPASSSRLVT
jgi:hypothetical protein